MRKHCSTFRKIFKNELDLVLKWVFKNKTIKFNIFANSQTHLK